MKYNHLLASIRFVCSATRPPFTAFGGDTVTRVVAARNPCDAGGADGFTYSIIVVDASDNCGDRRGEPPGGVD